MAYIIMAYIVNGLHSYGHSELKGLGALPGSGSPPMLCELHWIELATSSSSTHSAALYIGSISASPTTCPLRGYGRAIGDAETPMIVVRLGHIFAFVHGRMSSGT